MQLMVYPKNNRKRPPAAWRRRLRRGAAPVAILLFAGACYAWGGTWSGVVQAGIASVLESRYFSVREIQVRGGERVGGSELVALAGLNHGMSIWRIDPAAIEKKFAQHPWVRRVLVRREFPRRVVIEVEERTPRAILAMGRLYYVDGEGVIFKTVDEGDRLGLPLITGLRPEELRSPAAALRQRLKEALRLSELMVIHSHKLSEIHFAAAERVVLYTTAHPVALHMGWGDWDGKVQRVNRVLSVWKGHEERLSSLDASFHNQIVARLKNGGSNR